jgi:hypothetical protein
MVSVLSTTASKRLTNYYEGNNMNELIEIARRIFGPDVTPTQVEHVRHEFHHFDLE